MSEVSPMTGFEDRRVLVIGGDGFLGRNMIRRLVALGAAVTVLVRKRRHPDQGGVRRTLVGDMKDPIFARDAVQGHDLVLNFAGVTSAVSSNRSPSLSLMEECFPHLNMLAACAELAAPPLIVFPSSRMVYGRPDSLPVDERHPTRPTNVYGIHKLTVENYLRVYHETAGVPYLIFRISNPYGPLQPRHQSYGILNTFIQRALAGETIRLFGSGEQRRDFIYIDDLMDTVLRAVLTPSCHNDAYNLGGPEGISLREAAETVAGCVAGTRIVFEPWPEDYLKVETGDYVASFERLARHVPLPRFTPFREGIATTVRAYRDQWGEGDEDRRRSSL